MARVAERSGSHRFHTRRKPNGRRCCKRSTHCVLHTTAGSGRTMARIVILGGTGFFGDLISQRLPEALVVSRSSGVNANDPQQLRANLRRGDVVVDAAGPFQTRSAALLDAAIEIRFDIIDISDSPDYSSLFYARADEIRNAGIHVRTACSALSTVSAIALRGVDQPRKLTAFLIPASRYTANPATTSAVLMSLLGEKRTLNFPPPLGTRSGITVKSVDTLTLPDVPATEFVVDAGIPGMNMMFGAAARSALLRRQLQFMQPVSLAITRRVGKTEGVLAYEVIGAARTKYLMFLGKKSYLMAILPAVLAARTPREPGVVPPSQHLNADELFTRIRNEGGIDVVEQTED